MNNKQSALSKNGYMNEYYNNQVSGQNQQSPQQQQSNPILPPPNSYYTHHQQQPHQQQSQQQGQQQQQPTAQLHHTPQPTSQPQPPLIPTNLTSSNGNIGAKFTQTDIQILKQLLIAGEKHKWKQITKEINQSSPNNAGHFRQQSTTSSNSNQNSNNSPQNGNIAKNVSPTFVIKQYQSLLGLPNNALYFGSLGSSLPYVVAANGWDDLNYEYSSTFGDIE